MVERKRGFEKYKGNPAPHIPQPLLHHAEKLASKQLPSFYRFGNSPVSS